MRARTATVLCCTAAGSATASHAFLNQMVFATLDSAPSPIGGLILLQEAAWVWGMVFIELSGIADSSYFI